MSDEVANKLFNKVEELQKDVAKLLTLSEVRDKQCARQDALLQDITQRVRKLEQKGFSISTTVGVLAILASVWLLCGKDVHDNGNGADTVRNQLEQAGNNQRKLTERVGTLKKNLIVAQDEWSTSAGFFCFPD